MTHSATMLNVAAILDHHVRLRPDREAVVYKQARLSYAQFGRLVNQLANGLKAAGIGRGDHVALSCPNLPYFPMAYLAILRVGAVVVPLNVLFKPREIAYHLNDSDAAALLVFEGTPELPMAAMARAAVAEAPRCRTRVVMTAEPGPASPIEGARTLGQVMHGQPDACDVCPTAPDDTAVILYTSGTTGQPKGAELTHLNVTMNAAVTYALSVPVLETSPEKPYVVLVTLPLFHATGQVCQMITGLWGGNTLLLMPRFEPGPVLETMTREKVNSWIGVPTMYWTLLQHARVHGIDPEPIAATMRFAGSGGAPMPVEVMKAVQTTFGVRVLEGYGLSETGPVASFNHFERPSRPGTVGQPLLGVEIRCVDEQDQPVPAGEPGEVVIRGHNVMKGYYKRPDATAEAMRGGWFHTGDIGILDADGYLAIVDRKKDIILRGGCNVYPREIEEVLLTHPAVSLAAVVGVPDERLGEEIKAYVVRKPNAEITEDALVAWCREQFAAYKYPRIVEFREMLPVGPTGKILKRELRDAQAGQAGA